MFNQKVGVPVADKAKKISFYPESYNEYIDQKDMNKVSETVKIMSNDETIIPPKQATTGPVGYELHSPESVKIKPNKTVDEAQEPSCSPPDNSNAKSPY